MKRKRDDEVEEADGREISDAELFERITRIPPGSPGLPPSPAVGWVWVVGWGLDLMEADLAQTTAFCALPRPNKRDTRRITPHECRSWAQYPNTPQNSCRSPVVDTPLFDSLVTIVRSSKWAAMYAWVIFGRNYAKILRHQAPTSMEML